MSAILPPNQPQSLVLIHSLPADQHPALVYLASLGSDHSRRNMARYLDQIADLLTGGGCDLMTLDWSVLRFQHVQAVRAHLTERYAPATVNVMLSALRGVLKSAWRLGYVSAEDYHRAADVDNVKGETLPAGRDLQRGEILALVSACQHDDSAAGVRDAAIIGLLYTTGMRRAELVDLERAHYEAESGQVKVLSGKGRKDRIVYVTNGAQDALDDWLILRGDEPGPLFMPVSRRLGAMTGGPKPSSSRPRRSSTFRTRADGWIETGTPQLLPDTQFIAWRSDGSTTMGYAVVKDANEVKGRVKLNY